MASVPARERIPLRWVGSSREDLSEFPQEVRQDMGYALHQAQLGEKNGNAKPLKGFGGAGVLEVVDNFDGNTFRAVYTVKFKGVVYVLHAFQKKSKSGKATAQSDIELVKARLKSAEADYAQLKEKHDEKG
jgi:phage-related protein